MFKISLPAPVGKDASGVGSLVTVMHTFVTSASPSAAAAADSVAANVKSTCPVEAVQGLLAVDS